MPKRIGYLYDRICDRDFISETIEKAVHKRRRRKDCSWVIEHKQEVVENIHLMLVNGAYKPSRYHEMRIYDQSSQKYRDIRTVPFYPDCIIQWLIVEAARGSVFMRGMDYWSCASIPGRGGERIYKGIRRFIRHHHKSAKYAVSIDVRHYYDSIDINILMAKLRRRCKDKRFLALVEAVSRASSADGRKGIGIGYHLNQWLANFYLEDIDRLIRNDGSALFYARYMDNLTIIGSSKRKLHRLIGKIREWFEKDGLEMKSDWQLYPLSSRPVQAVGYRYLPNGEILLRKRNWLKLKRQIARTKRKVKEGSDIPKRMAMGFLSRMGSVRKHAPSRRIFSMASCIDFAVVRRAAIS